MTQADLETKVVAVTPAKVVAKSRSAKPAAPTARKTTRSASARPAPKTVPLQPPETTGFAKASKSTKAIKPVDVAGLAKPGNPGKPGNLAKPGKAIKVAAATTPKPLITKPAKIRLVRDSFTIPSDEYVVLGELKQRALASAFPVKKSELLRAGIKLLAALSDAALLRALKHVPTIKTGRPKSKKGE